MKTAILLFLACTCTLFGQPRLVLVSVAPYATILHELVQDDIEVALLVPAGFSSHTYEPTAKQMLKASKASLWFTLGEPFETKALKAIKSHNTHFASIDLRQGLSLLSDCCSKHHHSHDQDPHIWMSPKMMIQQVNLMAKTLQETFPELAENIQKRLPSLVEKLRMLDEEIEKQLINKKGSLLIVSHPAYGYFCRDYNLQQLPIEQEGKDPTPKQLTSLIETIKKEGIKTIFVQKQYSDKAAALIAKEVGGAIVTLDPYAQEYFENMRFIAQKIAIERIATE